MKYRLSPREIPRAEPEGFPEGSGDISSYTPTRVTIQSFSITSTSQYFLVLGPTEAKKPQYEKIFTSRIDNTRKYSHLELTIRENIHSSQSQYKKIFTSRDN